MPNAFDFASSPFDCLEPDEQRMVRDSVDIGYFREGETLVEPGSAPSHLFVVIKGAVTQFDGGEAVARFGPLDCFDGRALVAGRAASRFVAAEETLAYQLAKATVNELISRNATFGALLFSDLSKKLGALAERDQQREMRSLTMSRVREAFLRTAHQVDGATDIVAVTRVMQSERTNSLLVRDGERLGVFTNTGLQRAVLDGRALDALPVRELATFELVTVDADAPLFDALALMIRHQVHRLVVTEAGSVKGLLEQLDLLSFLSNHSYLITVQIVQAHDLDTLAGAAEKITRFIALLERGGTRVGEIGRLVQALNAKLFERAWQLVAPPQLVAESCLIVMGSEGRGEQLLKTDQDNALIVRDDCAQDDASIAQATERFSAALERFGYPECAGGIMASRPAWRQRESAFAAGVRRWLLKPEPEGLMALAIFMDAHAVAGDASLLRRVRAEIDQLVARDDASLGRFAAAIDYFPEAEGSWWNRLLAIGGEDALDLKKAATFPIVHGVRALALRERTAATSTAARLEALVVAGRVDARLAQDLVDALHFVMGLKLKAGLAEIERGQKVSGAVATSRLSSLERDLLKDALAVVRRFKTLVRHQFHLDGL